VDFSLTDEQERLRRRDPRLLPRECGTQEQREKLTEGHKLHHNFDLYKQMAELGWLGVTIPRSTAAPEGSMLDACLFMEETSRGLAPIGGYATTLIVAGATQRFGSEEQKAEILGGIAAARSRRSR
jgi:alkylation response protein AidB-like acyl-CoA dehydrogenase